MKSLKEGNSRIIINQIKTMTRVIKGRNRTINNSMCQRAYLDLDV